MEETLQLKRLVCCTITLFALAGKAVMYLIIFYVVVLVKNINNGKTSSSERQHVLHKKPVSANLIFFCVAIYPKNSH